MIRRQKRMELSRRLRGLVATLIFTVLFGVGCGAATSPETTPPTKKKVAPPKETAADKAANELFAGQIPKIRIDIPKEEMQSLRNDRKKSVKATVSEGSNTWKNVAIHVKGAAGSTRSIDDKPALTLNMDKFVKGQSFRGLDKFHLNNSVQDPSFMCEILCGDLYRRAGVPTARGTHARVWLNGRDLGLFVLKEGYDKTWLSRSFQSNKGNLYDGGFLTDIDGNIEMSSGLSQTNRSDLKALIAAANSPMSNRLERLGKILDLESFTTFCVLQVLTSDWDGYAAKPNNYRLYHDPKTGKFTFIPHGMDQMFWDSNYPITPGFNGMVARQTFAIPEMHARYVDRFQQIAEKVFVMESVTNHVAQLEARIRSSLEEFDKNWARDFPNNSRDIRDKVLNRSRSIHQQLASLPQPLRFDARGAAVVSGWQPRQESGNTRLDAVTTPDGRKAFQVVAASPGSAGSWRTRLNLPAGRYALEGRAKAKDVEAVKSEKGEGAGLRIGGNVQPRANKLSGSSDWTALSYDFSLANGGEVELVAELRANKGTVWFDPESLKLVKRP